MKTFDLYRDPVKSERVRGLLFPNLSLNTNKYPVKSLVNSEDYLSFHLYKTSVREWTSGSSRWTLTFPSPSDPLQLT